MATSFDDSGESEPPEALVTIREHGRIVIPKPARSVADVAGSMARLSIQHGGESVTTIVKVDDRGRCTIPVRAREYLGIEGQRVQLRIVIEALA